MVASPCFRLLVVLGPTASGKTRLAVEAARALGGEVLSADSRQVFRGMDLGTGKDREEYGEVPCHLIDLLDAGSEFSVFDFLARFNAAFRDVTVRDRLPVLAGGTGLYLDAVLRGYRLAEVPENPELRRELKAFSDAELAERLLALRRKQHNLTDLQDRQRLVRALEIAEGEAAGAAVVDLPEFAPLVFGLRWERSVLRRRITARLRQRLEAGMVEEVDRLHGSGVSWEALEYYGLEYRFIARHLQGMLGYNDMVQKLNSAIHQFAKRQETWFRRMERQGVTIRWLEGDGDPLQGLLRGVAEAWGASPRMAEDR